MVGFGVVCVVFVFCVGVVLFVLGGVWGVGGVVVFFV